MRGYGTGDDDGAGSADRRSVGGPPLDPIEFRRRNALGSKGRTMTGNPYSVSVRTAEILDKLEKHPIWRQRAQEKPARRKAFSSGRASPASPRITAPAPIVRWGASNSAEGKISIYCDHVEMGNGIGTALANRVALHLGGVADEVSVARVDSYDVLELVTSGDPYTMDQKTQDLAERNPRWVPAISSATSASIGAHVGTHSSAEAARLIFRFGLWPAALALWQISPNDPRARDWAKAQWKDGQLVLPGLIPAGIAGACRDRACTQSRDRGSGALLLALDLVARALSDRRRTIPGRN
jgi:CO/xanthine dehydrogenase Mo-binding subunit